MQSARNSEQKFSAPTAREISLSADELLGALLRLPAHLRLSILDSCGAPNPPARYLIAGYDPFEIIESRGAEMRIKARGREEKVVSGGDALAALDDRLAEYHVEDVTTEPLPVAGACIATFSYELVHRLESLRLDFPPATTNEPDVTLAFYDTLVVHDYQTGKTLVVGVSGPGRVDDVAAELLDAKGLQAESPLVGQPFVRGMESSLKRDEYLAGVQRIKEHIAAGDIYQANLTQRFTCRLSAEAMPETIFLRLRRDHPAPFAAFIRRRDDVVVSASPERFLRVKNVDGAHVVEAWPIKGTRPRGRDAEEDDRLRSDLLGSEKDRAENVMIVDLLRNDLGRVCRYGSVEVGELCSLEMHPTLFHLVSKVRGVLREGVTASALLRAAFPCGSITGAPKIRAMEIIAETEPCPRGLSMGAIGYFSFAGSLDLSVAIRTMVVDSQRHGGRAARFNVGGGIVADSCPSLEYEESLVKARALLAALGVGN
jgi:para-aminobenzoate synthetase component 1